MSLYKHLSTLPSISNLTLFANAFLLLFSILLHSFSPLLLLSYPTSSLLSPFLVLFCLPSTFPISTATVSSLSSCCLFILSPLHCHSFFSLLLLPFPFLPPHFFFYPNHLFPFPPLSLLPSRQPFPWYTAECSIVISILCPNDCVLMHHYCINRMTATGLLILLILKGFYNFFTVKFALSCGYCLAITQGLVF